MKRWQALIGLVMVLMTITGAFAATEWIDSVDPSASSSSSSGSVTPGSAGSLGSATFSTFITSKSGTKFTVTTTITNPADGQRISGVIELQARKTGQYLSFAQQPQPCDASTPQNVHGTVDILPGQTQTITLTSDTASLGDGVFSFYLVSVTQCCITGACDAIQPFGWQTLVAQSVPFGSTAGTLTNVACTYDFECAAPLNVDTSLSRCNAGGTTSAYCSVKSVTTTRSTFLGFSPSTWVIIIVFAIILIIVVLLRRRLL